MKTCRVLLAALFGFTARAAIAADLTERQQAAIRQEVDHAMKGFIAGCERIDVGSTLKFEADVPEFRFADTDGQLYDYPAFKKNLTTLFAGSSAQKIITQRQEIAVLGIDAALVEWHGALELVLKDGAVLRADPYNASFLFRRMDGAWKIVYQHESGPPPQPVPPAVQAPKAPRRVVTGVNAAGKSVVVSDGPVPPEGASASKGGNGADLWLLDHVPADLADSHDPIAGYKKRQWPPTGGVIARVATWPSGFAVQKHQSATIDFVFIISGSLELHLEEGSVTLGPGDSVVQRGTKHGWRVVGDQPCTLAAVLLAATK